MTREQLLARTLVELADTLVVGFDVIELMVLLVERSVELLDASTAGLLLADDAGRLHLLASTSESGDQMELFQLQQDEGPCVDCYREGVPVTSHDLSQCDERWPRFAPFALGRGARSSHAFPLRLRQRVLGALNLFRSEAGELTEADVVAGQALADVAAISLCQVRAVHDAELVIEQLQWALQSRVAIEQAKGMLAERAGIGMDEAFARLRSHARSSQRRLSQVAEELVSGHLAPDAVLAAPARRGA